MVIYATSLLLNLFTLNTCEVQYKERKAVIA